MCSHSDVYSRVLPGPFDGRKKILRPRLNPARMSLVEHRHGILVLRTLRFALVDRVLRVLRQLTSPLPLTPHEIRHFSDTGCEYESPQSLWLPHREASSKPPSPRMSKKIESILNAKGRNEILQLANEKIDCPEACVSFLFGEVRGEAVADLVVEDNGYAVARCQLGQTKQVVVHATGSTMCGYKRCLSGVEISRYPVVGHAGLACCWDVEGDLAVVQSAGGHGVSERC